jgi:vitamin B12 transporter
MFKFCLLTTLALSSPAAFAQEAPRPDASIDPKDSAIVVTAARSPIDAVRVAASMTIFDKAAIDRAQDTAVSDLLVRTPGVSLTRNGGYGTNTGLRIRGAEPDQTVVVIDGVKLNDPSSAGGGYNFANLLIGDASRIEILRGPQSILWGSQAIGGVVNIVTPLPEKSLEASFDLEGGSRETVNARAALGGRNGPLAWRIGGQAFTTDGISAVSPDFGGHDKDGYRNRTVNGRAVLDIVEGVSAEVRGYYAHGRAELDSTTGDTAEFTHNREFVGYAGLNVDLFDGRLRNRFAYGYTDTDRDNYNPAKERARTYGADGRNQRLEYQGSLAIATGWTSVFGVENERSRFSTVSPPALLATPIPDPTRGKAEITSVYGQVNGELVSGLALTGGVRRDDHSRYGAKTLFAGGAAWSLPNGTTLRASYAEGFKAPTLYQLFAEYGNAALDPEEAKGWEAGAEQALLDGAVRLSATYFQRTTRDQIVYSACAATPTAPLCFRPGTIIPRAGFYQNIARAQANGIEAVAAIKPIERLTIDANYSWVRSLDRSGGASDGNWLPRRPRNAANASVTYAWGAGISTGIALRWSGKTWDDAANTRRLDDYTLVDVRGELAISPALSVYARVENLFDEGYATAYRYGTLGRSAYLGVRGRF